jgi:hypothetical protein
MPSRPGREPGGGAADQQERTAAELADRAAESVDRRYDATKEIHHDERARAGSGEQAPAEDREDREDREKREDRGDGE